MEGACIGTSLSKYVTNLINTAKLSLFLVLLSKQTFTFLYKEHTKSEAKGFSFLFQSYKDVLRKIGTLSLKVQFFISKLFGRIMNGSSKLLRSINDDIFWQVVGYSVIINRKYF